MFRWLNDNTDSIMGWGLCLVAGLVVFSGGVVLPCAISVVALKLAHVI